MQIIVPQDEIATAVEMLVRSQISLKENQKISVEFTNVRSPNGMTAEVTITSSKFVMPVPATDTSSDEAEAPAAKPVQEAPAKPSIFAPKLAAVAASEPAEDTPAEEAPEETAAESEDEAKDEPEADATETEPESVEEAAEEPANEAPAPQPVSARSIFSKAR